jgi:hypothetical protein
MRLYNFFFHNHLLPKWFLLSNKISLCGVLAWPLVLFASFFMFRCIIILVMFLG